MTVLLLALGAYKLVDVAMRLLPVRPRWLKLTLVYALSAAGAALFADNVKDFLVLALAVAGTSGLIHEFNDLMQARTDSLKVAIFLENQRTGLVRAPGPR